MTGMTKITAHIASGGLVAALVMFDSGTVSAQDFFSQFFGGYSHRAERSFNRLNFAPDYQGYDEYERRPRRAQSAPRSRGGTQAYCVRTCDGRHFPVGGQGEQNNTATCKSLCPSSETRVFYGSSIDSAVSDKGSRYGDLPNAFKYRTELVSGCTCNGTPTGLAPVKVEDDPTLKRGDIVAGEDGLQVTRSSERRGASLDMSPVSREIRAKYERVPIEAN